MAAGIIRPRSGYSLNRICGSRPPSKGSGYTISSVIICSTTNGITPRYMSTSLMLFRRDRLQIEDRRRHRRREVGRLQHNADHDREPDRVDRDCLDDRIEDRNRDQNDRNPVQHEAQQERYDKNSDDRAVGAEAEVADQRASTTALPPLIRNALVKIVPPRMIIMVMAVIVIVLRSASVERPAQENWP